MSNIKPFRFWCQKVLPLVYDDSLSYYEVLCKMKDKINEVIDSFHDIQGEIEAYVNSPEFETWLKMYINSRKMEISSLAVIGDSNAEGYGWWGGNSLNKTNENDGYCAVLRELYPEATIDNYSVSGAFLRDISGNTAKEQCDALIRSGIKYEYIIIQVGMNDISTIMNSQNNIVGYAPTEKNTAMAYSDYNTCVRSLCTIVNRLRAYSPNSKIIYMVREFLTSPQTVAYYYELYCAFYKQIFETCYLLNVPILNLNSNFINSTQNASNYYDVIHWNENAYRNYVTPRLVEFLNNPVSSGLIAENYMFLCCTLDDVFRGYNGRPYLVTDALKTALEYILQDSAYFEFHGTILYTGSPGTVGTIDVAALSPFIVAKIRRGVHDFEVVVSKYGNDYEYYINHISLAPEMSNDMTYSGAQNAIDNQSGYGLIPGGQTVFHEAFSDKYGGLTRSMNGAKIGELITSYNPETNVRQDFYKGGMLGASGEISLADGRIWNGVYYVPQPYISNVLLGLSSEDAGGYGYTIIINRQIPGNGVYGIAFAISITGVYYMLNYDGNWHPCIAGGLE